MVQVRELVFPHESQGGPNVEEGCPLSNREGPSAAGGSGVPQGDPQSQGSGDNLRVVVMNLVVEEAMVEASREVVFMEETAFRMVNLVLWVEEVRGSWRWFSCRWTWISRWGSWRRLAWRRAPPGGGFPQSHPGGGGAGMLLGNVPAWLGGLMAQQESVRAVDLPMLPELSESEVGPLVAGDWITTIGPFLRDMSSSSSVWWDEVLRVAGAL